MTDIGNLVGPACDARAAGASDAPEAAGVRTQRRLWRRVKAALVAGPCIALLAAGASLEPHASGFGTARQLGVPVCSVLARTGWPCPSCGLTTSVAAMVHGDIALALRAQAFGVILTLACVVLACAGLVQLVTGRPVLVTFRLGWRWVAAGLAAMLLGWGVKVLLGMADGTFPLR